MLPTLSLVYYIFRHFQFFDEGQKLCNIQF